MNLAEQKLVAFVEAILVFVGTPVAGVVLFFLCLASFLGIGIWIGLSSRPCGTSQNRRAG